MRDDIKTEWLTALRSGEYEQGQQYLQKDGKFCCLGVLCEIAVKHGESVRDDDSSYEDGTVTYDGGQTAFPEYNVPEWAELDTSFAWVLAYANDDGKTFNQIADMIEEKA